MNLTHIFNLLSLTNELIEVSLLRHEFIFSFCIFQSADDPSNSFAKALTLVEMNVKHVQHFLMTKQHVSISNIAHLIQRMKYAIDRIKKCYQSNICVRFFKSFIFMNFERDARSVVQLSDVIHGSLVLLLLGFFV